MMKRSVMLPWGLALSILFAGLWLAVAPIAAQGTQKDAVQKKQETKVFYTCPMHPQVVQDKSGNCPVCGTTLAKKTVQRTWSKRKVAAPSKVLSGQQLQKLSKLKNAAAYTCPMHPEVAQDKPGKCPKCGMALEKKPVKDILKAQKEQAAKEKE